MPYELRKSGDGYKVFKKNSSKSFSKKPMSKEKAKKQMAALYIHSDDINKTNFEAILEDVLSNL